MTEESAGRRQYDDFLQYVHQDLSDLKKGMALLNTAVARLTGAEESRKRAQEDIQRLFELHSGLRESVHKEINAANERHEKRHDALQSQVSRLEIEVTSLGGNLKQHGKLGLWLVNNGAALAIAIVASAFSAWLVVLFAATG